ncbi:DUF488 domain-containing protein [Bradyrhizobium guangdongense]
MTRRLRDPDARRALDLQLDTELEETFPASDPLKVTRFAAAMNGPHPSRTMLTSRLNGRPPSRSNGKGRTKAMSRKGADRVKIKRAYEPPVFEDGTRVLIDRLWPRGVRKANAAIDEWMKALAPSTQLRKWFGHAPERWPEFQRRYRSEIQRHPAELNRLRELAQDGPITLVYAAHDDAHNDAVVLRNILLEGH